MTYKYWETCAERELGSIPAAAEDPAGESREVSAADDGTAVVESEKDGMIPVSAPASGITDTPTANIDSAEYVKSEADKAGPQRRPVKPHRDLLLRPGRSKACGGAAARCALNVAARRDRL